MISTRKEQPTNTVDGSWSDEHDDESGSGSENSQKISREEAAEKERLDRIAKTETQQVKSWKITTILTILMVASAVSAGCFIVLTEQENEDFETSFQIFARTIEDATEYHVKTLFTTLGDTAEHITAEAASRREEFPFVTAPLFEILGQQTRSMSGIESIYWGPRIEPAMQADWINYTLANQDWLRVSRSLEIEDKNSSWEEKEYDEIAITPVVFEIDSSGEVPQIALPKDQDGPWEPYWQMSPPISLSGLINYNLLAEDYIRVVEDAADTLKHGVFDQVRDFSGLSGLGMSVKEHDEFHASLVKSDRRQDVKDSFVSPHVNLVNPIFESVFDMKNSKIVGHLFSLITWDRYLVNLLPEGIGGIVIVLRNNCDQVFTYEIDGNFAIYLGEGDRHNGKYDDLEVVIPFYLFNDLDAAQATEGHCMYSLHVFPEETLENEYRTSFPAIMTVIVLSTFMFLVIVFFVYDNFVARRNRKMLHAVAKSNAIVSSLFPSNVRDRLFNEAGTSQGKKADSSSKTRLKNYLSSGASVEDESNVDDDDFYGTAPIADLFTDTTILFADLAGFTAWSSTREPVHVFVLLETLYKAFDEIAKKRRVFKVETMETVVNVAVTGLPEPRADHALVMVRFAVDCLEKTKILLEKLSAKLGPDTVDLDMRIGIHSGPVTAGVLRGEKSRFQLFGDTMNTASRIESNGKKGKIHLSQETADLVVAAGKERWLSLREDKIIAKGKGELTTYWLEAEKLSMSKATSSLGSSSDPGDALVEESLPGTQDLGEMLDGKTQRLISWNVDVLADLLKHIVARRGQDIGNEMKPKNNSQPSSLTVLEEVSEIISLPEFDISQEKLSSDSVCLDETVQQQLQQYVTVISSMYRENPFHNFAHASHVAMSVNKLMGRIISPDADTVTATCDRTVALKIASDPITHFASVFSALIHDVDHPGVPNTRLSIENPALADFYKHKSVAEQNSVDLSWSLLQDPAYSDLRKAIYRTESERVRFRQLVVNSVLATDLLDKDLKSLRNARWERAFNGNAFDASSRELVDRKATIVIEHVIQASDVAHTMQHWHVYRKWNEQLFEEMYSAFVEGRAEIDPSQNWYKGELAFFEFYIIPLAKKLKDCGVFGVSSDEYLNYAEQNKAEWEQRGQEVVAQMVERIRLKYHG